ncbi:Mut7-C RNAse domain-containing protein [Sorangium sp. So ce887]|uniref:Mut7-C RNAse domain-containing protein n=1 Tax=Sorangium sp. So ce887 TaxID=3133324 RepID=UPI003F5DE80F
MGISRPGALAARGPGAILSPWGVLVGEEGGGADPAQDGADPAQDGADPAQDGAAAPSFLCDAMLGGLSRWLRGAGYDATFEHGIDDGDLVRLAQQTGRVLLSSDAGVFDRRPLRTAAVRGLYVPRGLRPMEQAGFVLRELGLRVRDPRCMACGGALAAAPKDTVRGAVPGRVADRYDEFWRCERCDKVLWKGSHWEGIAAGVAAAAAGAGAEPPAAMSIAARRQRSST